MLGTSAAALKATSCWAMQRHASHQVGIINACHTEFILDNIKYFHMFYYFSNLRWRG